MRLVSLIYSVCLGLGASLLQATERPNIVIILADDMGFGELSCLNPEGKIKTPQLDKIAASGMIFTDGHSGSSVCTPTRYGLMTGRYSWRTRLQKSVLQGGESLIAKERLTIADMLKKEGYHTCMVGKWHLGMLYDGKENSGKVGIGAKVTESPVTHGGFDEFYGFHHSRQMTVWIENDKVTENIEPVEMLPKLTAKAVEYIESRKGNEQPFFLYVPWNSPHSPVVPSPEWQGKSGINGHADFVMQTDDSYGQVVQALKDNGLIDNTIIICSSDNGTSPQTSGLKELTAVGHSPSGPLRGNKADFWDGGHRVPFIVSWSGKVKAGSSTDQLACLTDVYATVADILDITYPETEGVDSISFLPALLGNESDQVRQDVISHSFLGLFAIRKGHWKLCCGPGSGGWGKPTPTQAVKQGLPMIQLYNMDKDLGEQENLHQKHPEIVKELRAMLEKQIADGRSTPGVKQKNAITTDKIVIDKIKSPAN